MQKTLNNFLDYFNEKVEGICAQCGEPIIFARGDCCLELNSIKFHSRCKDMPPNPNTYIPKSWARRKRVRY